MNTKEQLLRRLDHIGHSLAASGHGLALIGLGSVGLETNRLDEYSDLDFFAIVARGFKPRYLGNLDWLDSIMPLAYSFRNTADGYKALFSDGIFCEFAVFEPEELPRIPFAPGRIVWKREDVTDSIAVPTLSKNTPVAGRADWGVGEALTNLYVGMCRFCRGEKLAAMRLVQQHAVDRILEMTESQGTKSTASQDPFSLERRIEQRHPEIAAWLPQFIPGYDHTPEAALAILEYLCRAHPVNQALAAEIRTLCARSRQ